MFKDPWYCIGVALFAAGCALIGLAIGTWAAR